MKTLVTLSITLGVDVRQHTRVPGSRRNVPTKTTVLPTPGLGRWVTLKKHGSHFLIGVMAHLVVILLLGSHTLTQMVV
ncbi:hypothetical protein [Fibrella arboris]|uniref:hypothetical protein n=1 Tax=Fibrella arboris TaxID=3242486 RepID=UPI0035210246